MTDFQQSDLTLQLIKVLCVSNIPIHDTHLILSCFHMDRTRNGENNDKSVSTESVLPTLPPLQFISCSLFPNQVAPREGAALGCHW